MILRLHLSDAETITVHFSDEDIPFAVALENAYLTLKTILEQLNYEVEP